MIFIEVIKIDSGNLLKHKQNQFENWRKKIENYKRYIYYPLLIS